MILLYECLFVIVEKLLSFILTILPILSPNSLSHMLKEVNGSANVVCEKPHQVVDTLAYVIRGELPSTPRDGDKFGPIADRLGKGNPNP